MSEPERIVVADPEAAALEAAVRIGDILADAVEGRAAAHWATTGGSAALGTYRRLAAAPLRDAIPWPGVEVWWGDDRYVPRDHPYSNVKPLDDVLLPGVPILVEHLHPFRTSEAIGEGRGIDWCAAQLAEELRSADLERLDGWPVFDLVTLGIGTDGHLMSVFAGSPALDSGALAMAIAAPTHIEPHVQRLTLNPAIVTVARHVLVVAHGAEKAPVLADVLGPENDPNRWPAQLARREGATWILDEAAASGLRAP